MDVVQIFCTSSLLEQTGMSSSSSFFHWHSLSFTSSSTVQAVLTTRRREKIELVGCNPTWALEQILVSWESCLLIISEFFIPKGCVHDSLQGIQRNISEVCLSGVVLFLVNFSPLSFNFSLRLVVGWNRTVMKWEERTPYWGRISWVCGCCMCLYTTGYPAGFKWTLSFSKEWKTHGV